MAPLNYAYVPGRPERYIAPGSAYAAADGTEGTDITPRQSIRPSSIRGQPVLLGPYNYLFSNLVIPGGQQLVGQGIHHSNLICKIGSTGTMVTDAGRRHGAAKIDIRGVAFYGNRCSYSGGLRLGHNTVPFGTEGVLDCIWVRDLPGGFPGIDINGNVAELGFLVAQNTGGLQLVGTAITALQLECVGCSGFQVGSSKTVCNFGDAQIGALEVEAQDSGTGAVYLTGNASFGMLTVSLRPGFASEHLIEIGPGSTTWSIHNFKLYFQGAPPRISRGNFKVGSVYFGGDATGKNYAGQGNYLSGLMTQGGQFGFKLQQFNAFSVRIENDGGVIKHLIGAVGSPMTATHIATSVIDASSSPTTTPTGTDATTAPASGVKISDASPSVLILDTGHSGSWDPADSAFSASIAYNNTGTSSQVDYFVGRARSRRLDPSGCSISNSTTRRRAPPPAGPQLSEARATLST